MFPTAEIVTDLQKFVFASLNCMTLLALAWFLPSEVKVTRDGEAESIEILSGINKATFARIG